jgi:hypothetical protein
LAAAACHLPCLDASGHQQAYYHQLLLLLQLPLLLLLPLHCQQAGPAYAWLSLRLKARGVFDRNVVFVTVSVRRFSAPDGQAGHLYPWVLSVVYGMERNLRLPTWTGVHQYVGVHKSLCWQRCTHLCPLLK